MDSRFKRLSYLSNLPIEVLVDDEDLERINLYIGWNILTRDTDKKVYCYHSGETIYLHRVVMNCPEYAIVDHKNGNGLDNRKENLRITFQQFNVCNRVVSANKKSKLPKGVTLRPNGCYRARISNDGIIYQLGEFLRVRDAAEAYNKAAVKYFGQYAKLTDLTGL